MTATRTSVFFYGSFIDPGVLSGSGLVPENIEVARLSGYDICIAPLATLVRSDRHSIYRILCTAHQDDLQRLYGQTWVAAYRPEAVIVETGQGRLTPALCWIALMITVAGPGLIAAEQPSEIVSVIAAEQSGRTAGEIAGALAADQPAEIIRFEEIGLSIHPLGEGIWRHVTTTVMESGRPVPANGLIVTSDGEAILIDTGWNTVQTEAILDWIEKDLRSTPIGVVVTHSHADCMGGIEVALNRGLKTWAWSGTATLARNDGLRAPQTLFDDDLTIAVGDRRIELYYPGAGHAPDNIVAWLPGDRLLFGGCLVKSAQATDLGFRGNADLASWPDAIEAVRARFPDATVIVPGHGDPGGTELFTNTLRLLREARP